MDEKWKYHILFNGDNIAKFRWTDYKDDIDLFGYLKPVIIWNELADIRELLPNAEYGYLFLQSQLSLYRAFKAKCTYFKITDKDNDHINRTKHLVDQIMIKFKRLILNYFIVKGVKKLYGLLNQNKRNFNSIKCEVEPIKLFRIKNFDKYERPRTQYHELLLTLFRLWF